MIKKILMDPIGFIAFFVLLLSHVCMFLKIEPFFTWFYLFAWWSYIIIIDSIIFRLNGNSLIRSRGKEIFVLSIWSVVFWLIFESINFFLQNWYYINLPSNAIQRRTGIILAFATVLPGIFETSELLENSSIYRKVSIKKFEFSVFLPGILFFVGLLFAFLSIIFPRFFFPLIWGSFTLLLEPILYLFGGRSLLQDIKNGRPRKVLILLTSGLICGFLWEFWNFWAHSKWIYTLPFFNQGKLFEMPIAGFIGFPLFAIDCYVMYNFISFFRKGKGWEINTTPKGCSLPKPVKVLFLPVSILIFSFTVIHYMEKYTIDSYSPSLKDVPTISSKDYDYLSGKGLSRLHKFIKFCENPENMDKVSKELNLPYGNVKDWVDFAKIIEFQGIGIKNFLILKEIGIDSVSDLARADSKILFKKFNNNKPLRRIEVWINEAKKRKDRF